MDGGIFFVIFLNLSKPITEMISATPRRIGVERLVNGLAYNWVGVSTHAGSQSTNAYLRHALAVGTERKCHRSLQAEASPAPDYSDSTLRDDTGGAKQHAAWTFGTPPPSC